jgi:hypothetical protein
MKLRLLGSLVVPLAFACGGGGGNVTFAVEVLAPALPLTVAAGTPVPVEYIDYSQVRSVTTALFADADGDPATTADEIAIAPPRPGGFGVVHAVVWDTAGVPAGSYAVVARSDDGESTRTAVGAGVVTIPAAQVVSPPHGSVLDLPPRYVEALLAGADPATVNATTFRLLASGGDGTFGDGNETEVAPESISEAAPGVFRLVPDVTLAADTYRVVLGGHHAGGALELDGVDDFARVPADAAFRPGTGSWTVECWVLLVALGRPNPVVSCGAGDFDNGWRIQQEGASPFDERAYFQIAGDGAGDSMFALGPAVSQDRWMHLAGVFDAARGETRFYVDGLLEDIDTSGTAPASVTPAADLLVGRLGAEHGALRIDELRVWAAARTGDEIAAGRFQRVAGTEPGLSGAWSFDEESGQDLVDASTLANTGTLGADAAAAADDPLRIPSTAWPAIHDTLGAGYDLTFGGTVPPSNVDADGNFVADFEVR